MKETKLIKTKGLAIHRPSTMSQSSEYSKVYLSIDTFHGSALIY